MRNVAGVPEAVLIAQYAGRYIKNFRAETIDAYSPSSKKEIIVPVLRWYYNKQPDSGFDLRLRLSIHYTGSRQAIIITCKNKLSAGHREHTWGCIHEIRIPLHDPDGITKAEDYISGMIRDPWAKCQSLYCANRDT